MSAEYPLAVAKSDIDNSFSKCQLVLDSTTCEYNEDGCSYALPQRLLQTPSEKTDEFPTTNVAKTLKQVSTTLEGMYTLCSRLKIPN